MKELKLFWQASSKNFFYSSILLIGSYFEVTNHYSLFLQFMKVIHEDSTGFAASGYFIKFTAIIAALFFISCIIGFGIKRDLPLSWAMSFVTILISFSVYSKINLSWEESQIGSRHISVVLLAGCLPLIVAYCTHKIGADMQVNTEDELEILEAKYLKEQQIKSIKAKFNDLPKFKTIRIGHSKPTMSKEPQKINEVFEQFKEQITVTPTVTSNQAPSETIIKNDTELDIMDILHGQLEEKK